jgi:hypothetical protein
MVISLITKVVICGFTLGIKLVMRSQKLSKKKMLIGLVRAYYVAFYGMIFHQMLLQHFRIP